MFSLREFLNMEPDREGPPTARSRDQRTNAEPQHGNATESQQQQLEGRQFARHGALTFAITGVKKQSDAEIGRAHV